MNPHKISPGYDTLHIDSVHVVVKVKSYVARLWSSAPLSYTHMHISMNTRIMLVKYQVSDKR